MYETSKCYTCTEYMLYNYVIIIIIIVVFDDGCQWCFIYSVSHKWSLRLIKTLEPAATGHDVTLIAIDPTFVHV